MGTKKKGAVLAFCGIFAVMAVVLFMGRQRMEPVDDKSTGEPATVTEDGAAGKKKAKKKETADNEGMSGKKELSEKETECINPKGNTLETRVQTPAGYERKEASANSLMAFMRSYPLKEDGKPVLLYDGTEKGNQDAHAAVFKLPLEQEDLQQCADSVMRVYAEYFWKTKQKECISFRFVDGFQADYTKWRDGWRVQVGENSSSWVVGGKRDTSYKAFQKYMRIVFSYASTLSLKQESKKIHLSDLDVGDIFLKAGSPGHVVMVVDVCVAADGRKAFLLAQGYMPAQEFHLLNNPAHEGAPWYYVEEVSYPFETPEYTFDKGSLRRLNY